MNWVTISRIAVTLILWGIIIYGLTVASQHLPSLESVAVGTGLIVLGSFILGIRFILGD